jgi:peroxiredoxin
VFVYLVENYYMKGDAVWLTSDELNKYIDRAMKIAPNVIGNLAPEINLPNFATKKDERLNSLKAKYTLVVFYAPTCGHCKDEIPKIDSVYRATLKAKGMKIYAVSTEADEVAAKDFITRYKLGDWVTTWDPDHTGDWRSKYDVYSTPSIYLLDEKKIIRGKRLDHSNIANLVEMLERKPKD